MEQKEFVVTESALERGSKTPQALPIPTWRPYALRLPFLVFLTVGSAAIIGGTEALVRLSLRPGAIITFHLEQPASCLSANQYCSYASSTVSNGLYFCYKYLPTLVGIVFGALCSMVDFEIRRLEPFSRLAAPAGALAKDSLLLNYASMSIVKVPYVALKSKHYLVLLSFVLNLVGGIAVPTLLSALLDVDIAEATEPKLDGTWLATVHTDNAFARASQAVSAVLIVLLLSLSFGLHRRRITGLFSNPGSVAFTAAICGKSLSKDLHNLDLASERVIKKLISGRRYTLHTISDDAGRPCQQLDRLPLDDGDDNSDTAAPPEFNKPARDVNTGIGFTFTWMFMTIVAVFFGLEALSDRTYLRFIFSHRAVPVLISVIIKQLWKTGEAELRAKEPFNYLSMHPLSKRKNFNDFRRIFRSWHINRGFRIVPGLAKETVFLDYTSMDPFSVPLRAAMNQHLTVCIVATISWLVEILAVLMGSLGTLPCYKYRACDAQKPVDASVTAINAQVGYCFAVLILVAFATAFMVLPRALSGKLNRAPDTLASVLCWLHSSRINEAMRPMSAMPPAQRRRFQAGLADTRYGLGWIGSEEGRAGPERFGIDSEPVGPYVMRLMEGGKNDVVRYKPGEQILGPRALRDVGPKYH